MKKDNCTGLNSPEREDLRKSLHRTQINAVQHQAVRRSKGVEDIENVRTDFSQYFETACFCYDFACFIPSVKDILREMTYLYVCRLNLSSEGGKTKLNETLKLWSYLTQMSGERETLSEILNFFGEATEMFEEYE